MDWPVRKLFQFIWTGRWPYILYVPHCIWTGRTRHCTILYGPARNGMIASDMDHTRYCSIPDELAEQDIVTSQMHWPDRKLYHCKWTSSAYKTLYHSKWTGRRGNCTIANRPAEQDIVTSQMDRLYGTLYYPKWTGRRGNCTIANGLAIQDIVPLQMDRPNRVLYHPK